MGRGDDGRVLVVDTANVVGSRPNGWWRDRPAAARNLCSRLHAAVQAGRLEPPVVAVLEGAARPGVEAGERDGLRVVHADHSGDDAIAELVAREAAGGADVTVVTADRQLRERVVSAGGRVVGPRWLLSRLDS
jgi:hypothetical protein